MIENYMEILTILPHEDSKTFIFAEPHNRKNCRGLHLKADSDFYKELQHAETRDTVLLQSSDDGTKCLGIRWFPAIQAVVHAIETAEKQNIQPDNEEQED